MLSYKSASRLKHRKLGEGRQRKDLKVGGGRGGGKQPTSRLKLLCACHFKIIFRVKSNYHERTADR